MFSNASGDVEVHVEGPLGLPDEAEVGVVDDDVDVGQVVLGPDGELLEHELEVVVAGEGDDRPRSGRAVATPSAAGPVQPSGPAWPALIQCRGR